MLFSTRKVAKAVLVLAAFSVLMTAVTLLTLNNGRISSGSLQELASKGKSWSAESIDEALGYFVNSAEFLISAVKYAVTDNFANATAILNSIRKVKDRMETLLSEFEHQLHGNEIKKLLSLPVINNHSFSYNHNHEDICSKKEVKIVFVVPSAPANIERRRTVRNGTIGNYIRNNTKNAILLFFLGRPSTKQNFTLLQNKIDNEVIEFGDIIQVDFEDVYSNNRLKSVSMLRWVSTYCSNAKFVIRLDDDVNVKVPAVIEAAERTGQTLTNFIIGRKRVEDRPARNVGNKYYLSKKEFPESTFPPYLLGGLLVYPVSTAKLLYQAALRVKPIWLEDVYITGICASKLYIPILSNPAVVFQHRKTTK